MSSNSYHSRHFLLPVRTQKTLAFMGAPENLDNINIISIYGTIKEQWRWEKFDELISGTGALCKWAVKYGRSGCRENRRLFKTWNFTGWMQSQLSYWQWWRWQDFLEPERLLSTVIICSALQSSPWSPDLLKTTEVKGRLISIFILERNHSICPISHILQIPKIEESKGFCGIPQLNPGKKLRY